MELRMSEPPDFSPDWIILPRETLSQAILCVLQAAAALQSGNFSPISGGDFPLITGDCIGKAIRNGSGKLAIGAAKVFLYKYDY
jgi:hypothetical protein